MKSFPLVANRRPAVLFLLSRARNNDLLTQTLAECCELIRGLANRERLKSVDLIVTDLSNFRIERSWIEQRKKKEQIFLPVVGLLTASEYADSVLDLFDDVVRIPCLKSELKHRFKTLLQARSLAVERQEFIRKLSGEVSDLSGQRDADSVLKEQLRVLARTVEDERLKLEAIISHAPAAIALWKGPFLHHEIANTEYDKIWGRPMKGRDLLEAAPELRDQEFPQLILDVLRTGKTITGRESRAEIVNPQTGLREERYYDFSYTRVLDAQGAPYGVFDHAIDVTDRVKANKELAASNTRAQEAELRLIEAVKVAHVGFFTWSIQQNSFELSDQFKADWGVDSGISLEDALNILVPEDREATKKAIYDAIEYKTAYSAQYRIIRPTDGKLVWIEAKGAVTFDDSGLAQKFFGTTVDITDQKRSEQLILESRDEADRANSAKSSFLANMSHEIRSPLGAVIGFAELLRSDDLQHADVVKYATVIERNSQHLLRLVDDILDLSKIEAGKMTFENMDFSLAGLLEDFLVLFKFKASENGIQFDIKQEGALPSSVIADPTRIRQILTNIVGNAVKFTHQGRVQLTIAFETSQLRFVISDTGAGMTQEQASRLFQPFTQADVSTTRKFGGTGLGLHLTRKICEAMGGSFNLISTAPGRGTTFEAIIKVKVPPGTAMLDSIWRNQQSTVQRVTSVNQPQSLKGLKILVIDDSIDNQDLLRMILGKMGVLVETANDGIDGMNLALTNDYDAVLCDVQMPRMDGYQTVSELKSRGYTKPVLALTAHAMKEERDRALNSGFSDYLTKPILKDNLIQALKPFVKTADDVRQPFPSN